MKLILIIAAVGALTMGAKTCKKKEKKQEMESLAAGCYKGRLEVKAACMNYTIGVIGGGMDTSMVIGQWKNEESGKTFTNVFALGSRCTFPSTINEGDEFYFRIDSGTVQNCAVCMIYYPTPSKRLSIKVLDQPCKP